MVHDPVNGTTEEGRSKDTPLANSGCRLEAVGCRWPDPDTSTGASVKVAYKIEHNSRCADPLKSQPKSRPVHRVECGFQVDVRMRISIHCCKSIAVKFTFSPPPYICSAPSTLPYKSRPTPPWLSQTIELKRLESFDSGVVRRTLRCDWISFYQASSSRPIRRTKTHQYYQPTQQSALGSEQTRCAYDCFTWLVN